jgi:pimeloyl-ACP methyl ester carboxylesterase
MTVVFVHGVPESASLWDRLRTHIPGDSVALSLPGFGTPRPDGFTATKDEYVAWLEDELLAMGEPVHLVGHDWGAVLVARVAGRGAVPLRSWAIDVAGICHPDYVWHVLAQTWQKEQVGEAWLTGTLEAAGQDSPLNPTTQLVQAGMPPTDAAEAAQVFDETMGTCILDLYRSALPNPYADWGTEWTSPTKAPGLVLKPTEDPFDTPASEDVADRLGARTASLIGLGHWWMLEDSEQAATVLKTFWQTTL